MSTWKNAHVIHFDHNIGEWVEFYNVGAEYRIGDLNMTQTVECHCGRRYLTQAQADVCAHAPATPINTEYWPSWTDIQPGDSMVYYQSRNIPSDGFHGATYDDDL